MNIRKMEIKHDIKGLQNAMSRAVKPKLQISAVEALGRIGDEMVLGPLIGGFRDKDHSVVMSCVNALVIIGQPAVDKLILALRDQFICRTAAYTLGKIGDSRAYEPLRLIVKAYSLAR